MFIDKIAQSFEILAPLSGFQKFHETISQAAKQHWYQGVCTISKPFEHFYTRSPDHADVRLSDSVKNIHKEAKVYCSS